MDNPDLYRPTESDFDEITRVWERSVRATHTFLTEDDIAFFKPLVRHESLPASELYCLKNDDGHITAFMGIEGRKLDMLFVSPEERGKGLGKHLVRYAVDILGIDSVDVNEQNQQAAGFYYKLGFGVVSRSETDGMGKPFPILHLKLNY